MFTVTVSDLSYSDSENRMDRGYGDSQNRITDRAEVGREKFKQGPPILWPKPKHVTQV